MRSFALFDVASDAAAASCDAPAETRAASAQRSGSAGGAETAVSPPAHDAWCAADFAWDPRELVRTALLANGTRPETRLTRCCRAAGGVRGPARAPPAAQARAHVRHTPAAAVLRGGGLRAEPERGHPRQGERHLAGRTRVIVRSRRFHAQAYNVRYRICELHLRAASVDVDGTATRWCQTCVRALLA